MAIMIINSEGNVVENGNTEEVPSAPLMPRLEEVVPNSDTIRRSIEEEQIIIAQLLGYPLA